MQSCKESLDKLSVHGKEATKQTDDEVIEFDITERFPIAETDYQIFKTKENPYGMVRQIQNNQMFKFPDHKPQYDKIADAVMKNVQQQMVETYDLQEIMIPENKHIDEEYHVLPKNNIFMSKEFYNPNVEQN